ncbi:unnamed protein product, partial [Menidia menidia]
MGLKDHLEDGPGHMLSLGLDLDYLHVDGGERRASPVAAVTGGGRASGGGGGGGGGSRASISTRSSCSSSSFSEESAVSDSEDERLNAPGSASGGPRPDRPRPLPSPPSDCRSKVDFALKLGYSEELVLLVLGKLGPGALINDVLGELVKLGTRMEAEPEGGVASPAPCSSLASSLHGNKEVFSCQGIQLAVDWFLERGHRDVTVFVPAWRKE